MAVSVRALVTGGTSGIGEAVVERLSSGGAAVVFTGRDEARGAAVAARTAATFVRADLRDAGAVAASVAQAVAVLGGLDAAVLNAGVLHEASLSETTDDAWDAVLETNLIGPYRYALACLPELRAAGGGSIVLVGSDAGVWGEVAIGAYSVSKRAAIMLAQMLGTEAGPAGVRVNAVCPGDTLPGMVTRVGGRATPSDPSGWPVPPLGRIGTAQDTVAAVEFLLSPGSSFVNGAVLLVDGGMRASLHAAAVSGG
ncbi:MAG: SDR family oxidoreductase [Thermoleophilia bacterium]|nr:SDR family oxidoreductase [Thermoleophilia bacterium]